MYLVINSEVMGVVVLHLNTKNVLNYKGQGVGTESVRRISEFLTLAPELVLYRSKSKSKALRMANMYSVVL